MKITFFICVSLVMSLQVYPQEQQRVVSGVVVDVATFTPLEGVTVATNASKLYSESQTDGIFFIPVSRADSVLIFTSGEYAEEVVQIADSESLLVKLQKKTSGDLSRSALTALLPGQWRGTFKLPLGVEVPFNFEVSQTDGALSVSLINGEEKFATGTLSIAGDSAFIPLDLFDNELAFTANGNTLNGILRRQERHGTGTSFEAVKAEYRFAETGTPPVTDITGTYDVVFKDAGGAEEKAVGVFRQNGNKLQATFLRVTGDSRYLDGIIDGNRVQLSSFIGSSPVYYRASVNKDGSLSGESVGARGSLPFTAIPNATAALPDAYTLTRLKAGMSQFTFRFPDAEGRIISN